LKCIGVLLALQGLVQFSSLFLVNFPLFLYCNVDSQREREYEKIVRAQP